MKSVRTAVTSAFRTSTFHYPRWAVMMLITLTMPALIAGSAGARPARGPDGTPVRLSLTLGHSQPLRFGSPTLAWSPDGRTLATGSPDDTVILWDAATHKPRATLAGPGDGVVALVWSPDGKQIAISDYDTTRLWNAATGRLRLRLKGGLLTQQGRQVYWPDTHSLATRVKPGVRSWDAATGRQRATLACDGSYYAQIVSWSPDGQQLVVDNGTSLGLWDVRSGTRRETLAKPECPLEDLAWSPAGTRIAGLGLGGDDLFLWDATTGRLCATPEVSWVRVMAWAPDGRTLATGSHKGEVDLWEGATGERRGSLPGDKENVEALAWSPDGKTLAVQTGGATTLWDVAARTRRATLPDASAPLVWRPDGRVLATNAGPGDDLVILWDARSGRRMASLPFLVAPISDGGIAWSPDGKTIAVGTGDEARGTTFLWDAASGSLRSTLPGHPTRVTSLAWSPDARSLATASGDFGPKDRFSGGALVWNRGGVFLWDAVTGQRHASLPEAAGLVAWSPDGTTLATSPGLRLWQPGPATSATALYPAQSATALAWSPDGKGLVAVQRWVEGLGMCAFANIRPSAHETLTVWELATREPRFSHEVPYVGVFAWSPDGRTIAVGGDEGETLLLDAATGAVRVVLSDTEQFAWEAAWSPDSRLLATVYRDGSVCLWHAAGGRRLAILSRGQETRERTIGRSWGDAPKPRLAWSPGGKTLAVSLDEPAVRLWDTATWQCRATLKGHIGEVRARAWSPDGKTLATGSSDGALRLWRADTGRVRAALYAIGQGRDWVTVTPGGCFLASPNGVGYVHGRQGDRLLAASELRRRCMRADAVRQALAE
jgi:WD40 repeat protein